MEPTKAHLSSKEDGDGVTATVSPGGGVAGVPATSGSLAAKSSAEKQQENRTVFDPRLPCERQKSRKFNRTSSYQCLVEVEGWLQAFPDLTIDDLGPGFSSSSFDNSQGLKIATYAWRHTGKPKGAIVLFHSYTSYTLFDFLRHQPQSATNAKEEDETWVQKYSGSWVEGFFDLGMNVYAMDHQSHGRSEGWKQWRCNVSKFDCFVDDAQQFLNEVVLGDPELPPNVPIVLVGYSMGGNVVIQTLGRIYSEEKELPLRQRVSHAVLLAPLIKIKLDRKTEFLLMINRSLITCFLPNLRFSREETSTDCPYLNWWYKKDPFTYSGRTKSRMVASLYDASQKLPKIMSKFPPQLKLLCLQGTNDQTVDFHAPLKLYESSVKLDLFYLCGWSHYIPKHTGADRLLGLVQAWIKKTALHDKPGAQAQHFRLLSIIGSAERDTPPDASVTP